jgi:hypothetical protein
MREIIFAGSQFCLNQIQAQNPHFRASSLSRLKMPVHCTFNKVLRFVWPCGGIWMVSRGKHSEKFPSAFGEYTYMIP